jgi:hypothetical protein
MAYVEIEEEFCKEYPTWIIAYCPDLNEWFTTNQRNFYCEYPDEFQCENDARFYFLNHIDDFLEMQEPMCYWTKTDLWLTTSKGTEKIR